MSETTALAVTNDELELVRRTVANGATDAELKLFLFDCKRRGVHPLDKLIHYTKRGGKYTPVTSIDFMRSQAAATGEMAGSDDVIFGDYVDGKMQPVAATVTVYRLTQGQRFAYAATARWSEYCPSQGQDHMWRKMPHTMLGKCAEALALRKAFPQQLAGLYAKEEMDQADSKGYAVEAPSGATPTGRLGADEEPSAQNGGDSGPLSLAAGVTQHGEEIPDDGHVYITRVDATPTRNKNLTKYLLTFSTGQQASTIKEPLAKLAEQLCQACAPVAYTGKTTKWGDELTTLTRAEPTERKAPAPMLTGAEIPF